MADEEDSKSFGGNTVWVQVPPPAVKSGFHFRKPLYFTSHYVLYQFISLTCSCLTSFLAAAAAFFCRRAFLPPRSSPCSFSACVSSSCIFLMSYLLIPLITFLLFLHPFSSFLFSVHTSFYLLFQRHRVVLCPPSSKQNNRLK